MATKRQLKWFLMALKGNDGFTLLQAFSAKEARRVIEKDGNTITHFRQISSVAWEALAKNPGAKVTHYSFDPQFIATAK